MEVVLVSMSSFEKVWVRPESKTPRPVGLYILVPGRAFLELFPAISSLLHERPLHVGDNAVRSADRLGIINNDRKRHIPVKDDSCVLHHDRDPVRCAVSRS